MGGIARRDDESSVAKEGTGRKGGVTKGQKDEAEERR